VRIDVHADDPVAPPHEIPAEATLPAARIQDAGPPGRHRIDEPSLPVDVPPLRGELHPPLRVPARMGRVGGNDLGPGAMGAHGASIPDPPPPQQTTKPPPPR